ncbi:purine-nucleoside phosphorylase [Paenibacillus cymbidii]|uniref:purine-nucleoside phosphorylase n=1 Tax=Paenibacillus cymbidii TaxID=1639034 RepID=UPI0010807DBB|nr:purine-nucleoside phosphorylase [Paenibacillus cymbidii]
MSQALLLQVEEAAAYLRPKLAVQPTVGLILGSGLGGLADSVMEPNVIPYGDIPHFPLSTVASHAGVLVGGRIGENPVLLMKGRFHRYEGYPYEMVTFPMRVMKALGVHTLIVTNAAGGINERYAVGELMLIRDHLNLTGDNPLIGRNEPTFGVRFPDMSEAYSKRLRTLAHDTAAAQGVRLQEGVYASVLGPSFETPAEIRMLRTLGADAVGMSTVPEVIVARHAGMEVLGISCVTNMASGMTEQPLTHEEVMETTERVKLQFMQLVAGIVEAL